MLTLAFAAMLFTSGGAGLNTQIIDVLDVQHTNVREPDGTLRYVVSNKALLPGAIIKGKEYKHSRGQAGTLFYDDEGSEIACTSAVPNWVPLST